MKKMILSLLIVTSSLFALSGESVYTQHCASCHNMEMPKGDMLAPPMPNVSKRLQQFINSKEKFVAFVRDYIQNPSQEKGHCRDRAFKRFGTMPPIGKSLTKEELDAVSLWLYENFKNPKQIKKCNEKNCNGKNCATKKANKNNKCGSNAKCGKGKCGSN